MFAPSIIFSKKMARNIDNTCLEKSSEEKEFRFNRTIDNGMKIAIHLQ